MTNRNHITQAALDDHNARQAAADGRRPEHTVAVTDALLEQVLSEVKTRRDLRTASTALREGAEQREDAGLDASRWRSAYRIACKNGGGVGGHPSVARATGRGPRQLSPARAVAAIRDALAGVPPFVPQEVAYRLPGREWKRCACKTRSAFERKLEQLEDRGAEVRTRDLDA